VERGMRAWKVMGVSGRRRRVRARRAREEGGVNLFVVCVVSRRFYLGGEGGVGWGMRCLPDGGA
jgi:hypothetical protein